MTSPVRVLHILPYLETGGTERHVLTLVQSLRSLRLCTGEVLAPAGPFAKELEEAAIPWTPFVAPRHGWLRSLHSFRQVLRMKQGQVALVHVHAAPDLLWAAAMSGTGHLPRVLTVHGFHGRGAPLSYRFAARLGSRFAQAIICVSGSEERLLLDAGAAPGKVRRVYNGVADAGAATPAMPASGPPGAVEREGGQPVRIAFVGRLSPVKGVDVLLRALARVAEAAGPGVFATLDIMGVGEEAAALQRLAGELGVHRRVRFLGYLPDAALRLAGYDVFCLPSREDMCPLVCVEAMSQGKPVIATNVGGIPELVVAGQTGLLVPPDDVAQLAGALLHVIRDPHLRRRMGEAARRRYEQFFTQETMARRTFEVYEGAMGPCRLEQR